MLTHTPHQRSGREQGLYAARLGLTIQSRPFMLRKIRDGANNVCIASPRLAVAGNLR
jgi:hypothetical protein